MEVGSEILVIILIILALLLSFAIGGNDETPAPLAAAGIIKFKYVLILGGVGLAIGTIFFSKKVASTVGGDFLGDVEYTIYMLLSVMISSIVWLIVGSFAGIPLSSTHSLFGSIIGVVFVVIINDPTITIFNAFVGSEIIGIFLSWVVSPLVGFFFSYILYKIVAKLFLKKLKGLNQIEKSEIFFSWVLLIAVFGVSLATGGNSAEALGIVYALYEGGAIFEGEFVMILVLLGIFAFLGLFIAGRYVIKNLASQTVDARPSEGFILQFAALIILIVYNDSGLPISHSHVIVFCIIGLNAAKKREIDYKGIGKMALYWVLTLPVAAILGGLIYFGFYMNGLI